MNKGQKTNLSRRDFIKITAVAGGVLAGGKLISALVKDNFVTVRETRVLMGTIINLAVVAESQAGGEKAAAATFAELERQVAIFSTRLPESPVSQLNRTGALDFPPAELVEVLQQAIAISQRTNGAFDVTVQPLLDLYRQAQPNLPDADSLSQALSSVDYRNIAVSANRIEFTRPEMAITLDGIAKGYIVDAGTAELNRLGYENVFVEAGGDLMASGLKDPETPWRVGVQSPRQQTNNILASFNISNQAAATSGDYMYYFSPDMTHHHILDPRLGLSPTELASVTILSQSAIHSDALATAVMVLGIQPGLALIEESPGVDGFLVGKDNQQYATSGFPAL